MTDRLTAGHRPRYGLTHRETAEERYRYFSRTDATFTVGVEAPGEKRIVQPTRPETIGDMVLQPELVPEGGPQVNPMAGFEYLKVALERINR